VELRISSKSVTLPRALSITRVTFDSISSVLAPDQVVKTDMDGASISGIISTAKCLKATTPIMNMLKKTIIVVTGLLTPNSESFMY
jgi:hypothetical protein